MHPIGPDLLVPSPAVGRDRLINDRIPVAATGVGRPRSVVAIVAGAALAAAGYDAIRAATWSIQPGLDFSKQVWGPARGIVEGYDPYAAQAPYLHAVHVPGGASLHPPGVVTMFGGLAALPQPVAYAVFFVLSTAVLWVALWLAASPRTKREGWLTAGTGIVVACTGPGELLFRLGQMTTFVVLGLVLVIRQRSTLSSAVGVALLTIAPTTALPLTVALLLMRRWKEVVAGWTVMAVVSLPAIVGVWSAAGGLGGLAHDAQRIMRKESPEFSQNRVDLLSRLTGNDAVSLVVTLVVVAVVVVVLARVHSTTAEILFAVVAIGLVGGYHQPYDLIVVFVALAIVLWTARRRWTEAAALGLVATFLLSSMLVATPLAHASDNTLPATWRLTNISAAVITLAAMLLLVITNVRRVRDR